MKNEDLERVELTPEHVNEMLDGYVCAGAYGKEFKARLLAEVEARGQVTGAELDAISKQLVREAQQGA